MDLLFFTIVSSRKKTKNYTGKSQGPAGAFPLSLGVTPRLPFLRISKEMSMWPSPPDPREPAGKGVITRGPRKTLTFRIFVFKFHRRHFRHSGIVKTTLPHEFDASSWCFRGFPLQKCIFFSSCRMWTANWWELIWRRRDFWSRKNWPVNGSKNGRKLVEIRRRGGEKWVKNPWIHGIHGSQWGLASGWLMVVSCSWNI